MTWRTLLSLKKKNVWFIGPGLILLVSLNEIIGVQDNLISVFFLEITS